MLDWRATFESFFRTMKNLPITSRPVLGYANITRYYMVSWDHGLSELTDVLDIQGSEWA